MSRRKLRPEERDLWNQIAQTAIPLNPPRKAPAASLLEPTVDPKPDATQSREPIPTFTIGEKAKTASRIPPTAPGRVHMDAKAYRKLSQGKLAPEARIDLHGMTVERAHGELTNFILRSHAKGRRLVLVITGKGNGAERPFPYQRGVLRRQVPHWLQQIPVAPLILQTTTASARHGGEGALYVYLRRRR